MKFSLVFFVLVLGKSFAQDNCTFNSYQKKGGFYFFSTYFKSDYKTPLEGKCETFVQGKLYESRTFIYGHIYEETLYTLDGKLRSEFKIIQQPGDTLLGYFKQYAENGSLKQHDIYYYDKTKRRCEYTQEIWPNGKLKTAQHFAWAKREDLDVYQLGNHPDHVIDDEGYTYLKSAFGNYYSYYENGQLKERYSFKPIYTPHVDELARFGPAVSYHENGILASKGSYMDSNKDGTWLFYDMNGNLYEENYYKDNLKTGTWKGYYSNGKSRFVAIYDVNSNHPFKPSITEWDENGIKTHEILYDAEGNYVEHKWSNEGTIVQSYAFNARNEPIGITLNWFANGKMHTRMNHNPNADTIYVEYYANQQIAKLIRTSMSDTNLVSKQVSKISIETPPYKELVKVKSTSVWYESGILQSETVDRTSQSTRHLSINNYSSTGTLIHLMVDNSKMRHEEVYFQNGQLAKEVNYINIRLVGNYREYDSLGQLRIDFNYFDGLRHGICMEFNAAGKLIYDQQFELGCIVKSYSSKVKTNPISLSTLSSEERKKIIISVYQLLSQTNQFTTKDYYTPTEIDSLVERLMWLKKSWNTSVDFPLEEEQNEHPIAHIEFHIPSVYYPYFYNGDTTSPFVRDFIKTFDSLNWELPAKMEKGENEYIFTHQDTNFYTYSFYQKHFYKLLLPGYARLPHMYQPRKEITFDVKNRIHREPSLSIVRFNSCVFIANFTYSGRSYPIYIYDDGTMEFVNRSVKWEDIKSTSEIPEIGWD
jgi:antitoxin component YwqK of YwqJK toxin-antitoxin module